MSDREYQADAPQTEQSNDYASRPGQNQAGIPVQKDSATVEDPIDPATADSDATLQADEKDAIDQSNVIEERTRGAAKPSGTYQEPGDDEVGLVA